MHAVGQPPGDLCVCKRWADLKTTYVYARSEPTSRRSMSMDYWVDLKMTYVYMHIRPTSSQPRCADVLGLDWSRPHCKNVLYPTWNRPMYSDALNSTYPEGPIHLNCSPSLLRITTKQSCNHISTKVGVTHTCLLPPMILGGLK